MLSGLFYSPPRRMMIGDPTHDRLATLGGTPLATLGRDPPSGRALKRCRQTYGCRRLYPATRDIGLRSMLPLVVCLSPVGRVYDPAPIRGAYALAPQVAPAGERWRPAMSAAIFMRTEPRVYSPKGAMCASPSRGTCRCVTPAHPPESSCVV